LIVSSLGKNRLNRSAAVFLQFGSGLEINFLLVHSQAKSVESSRNEQQEAFHDFGIVQQDHLIVRVAEIQGIMTGTDRSGELVKFLKVSYYMFRS
jgi:hypothetical protein